MARLARWSCALLEFVFVLATVASSGPPVRGDVTSAEVERAIEGGVRFLRARQQPDGSWPGDEGVTELATLALLTAGVPGDDPDLARALALIRRWSPDLIAKGHRTYAVALHAMVLAAADPKADRDLIARDAAWLVHAELLANPIAGAGRPRIIVPGGYRSGSWTYNEARGGVGIGDNSNTQYALLGLNAAAEAGIPIPAEVWRTARLHWLACQQFDGGWGYHFGVRQSTASMTTAGISSLIITGSRLFRGTEVLSGTEIRQCGGEVLEIPLQRGVDWLASHFSVQTNVGSGQHKLYYLYGLERAGRLAGLRYFGVNDWYRAGAEELVQMQNRAAGAWHDSGGQEVSTSFALLFLAKGRAPVLINKLRHGPGGDWNNDADDIRNLVGIVARDWKHLVTWQVVDSQVATPLDLLQAPIAYFNGHQAPEFDERGKRNLRDFVEQGGFILAEACCGRSEFNHRFHALVKEVFPEPGCELHRLGPEHAIWRIRYPIDPGRHILWGIEIGCRTVVVYSPQDLSCYWNQAENQPVHPAVVEAIQLGQNIVDYATGRDLPDDKLAVHEIKDFPADTPPRGALRIAKLKHAGEWDVAPRAIPNLMDALRRPPLNFDVVISQRALSPGDPSLVNYPLVYLHGRAAFDLSADLAILRRHLEPGGGVIFADAACGSPAFDAAFRRFVADLLPGKPLVPIPHDDEIYTQKVGFDLSGVQYSPAAGGHRDFPALEGVKLDGHWAVIYSKYDLGCALDHHQPPECRGYTHESALRIAANIVTYATLP
jgi:hypothetical protein